MIKNIFKNLWNERPHGVVFLLLIIVIFPIAYVWSFEQGKTPITPPLTSRCEGALSQDFKCFQQHFKEVTQLFGPEAAMRDLKQLYAHNSYVVAQCHQFAHVVGNTSAKLYPDIGTAFLHGDAFCWSGYYHGVVEKKAREFTAENIPNEADKFCSNIDDKAKYGFNYFNCVHGLGHGFMALAENELFSALSLCDSMTGTWEKESCYGGVFMENVMADERSPHSSKYLKEDDLLYPCNAVDERYKNQCYLMQTSYALTRNGHSFGSLFDMCANADKNFQDTCAQSIGRDASGQSVSDITQTREWCGLAHDSRQRENCIIGAVKDFISYFHSTDQAQQLCKTYDTNAQDKQVCEETITSYARVL